MLRPARRIRSRCSRGSSRSVLAVAATAVIAVAACSSDDGDTSGTSVTASRTDSAPGPTPETRASSAPEASTAPTAGSSSDAPTSIPDPSTSDTEPAGSTSFTPGPCSTQPPGLSVTCGVVPVPLHHDDPQAEAISLAVAVLEASDPDPGAAPILLLGGGPGEHTLAPLLEALDADVPLVGLAAGRDLVIVDQRGVGLSQPALDCPEYAEALATVRTTAEIREAALAGVTACKERLVASGVDLSAFDTAAGVQDVELVRQALGYERISIFGTSYGARLALQVARAFPASVESLVLSSPIPAEANFLVGAGESYDRALHAVSDACAADPVCGIAYPDVAGTLRSTLERLAVTPVMLEVPDPATGKTVPVPIDAATMATALFSLFYVPDGPAMVPYLVHAAAAGDLSAFTSATAFTGEVLLSHGLQLSSFCAEEATNAAPEEMTGGDIGAGAALIGSNPIVGPMLWELCAVWGVEPGDPATFEPVQTDVPTLLVTGQFDQITPPEYGRVVEKQASTAWYVEVPMVGHSPLIGAGECGLALLAAFVAQPTAEPTVTCELSGRDFYSPEEVEALIAQTATTTSAPAGG